MTVLLHEKERLSLKNLSGGEAGGKLALMFKKGDSKVETNLASYIN